MADPVTKPAPARLFQPPRTTRVFLAGGPRDGEAYTTTTPAPDCIAVFGTDKAPDCPSFYEKNRMSRKAPVVSRN
jgi:hypothetical protein